MKKFLFIYNASPVDDSDTEAAWMSWFESLGENIIDIGNPFDGGKLVNKSGVIEISSWSDFVGGYSLISAEDMDAAVALAKGCPNEAGVRVFEAIPM